MDEYTVETETVFATKMHISGLAFKTLNDEYINFSAICEERGLKLEAWFVTTAAQDLMRLVQGYHGIEQILHNVANNDEYNGIYVHELLLLAFATWVGPMFYAAIATNGVQHSMYRTMSCVTVPMMSAEY